jgi:hypothetical protein
LFLWLFLWFFPVKIWSNSSVLFRQSRSHFKFCFQSVHFLGVTRGAQVAKRSADVLVLPDPHTRLTARERAWSTLNDPGFSALAQYWSIFILLTIVFSCVAFVVQSMPQYETSTESFWDIQVCVS